MDKKYAKLAAEKTLELLKIDSPSGFTENAAAWVYSEFQSMGYDVARTNKGGVTVNLGGKFSEDALMLEAHVDTLGGMVSAVLPSGRLKITPIGGLNADNVESENVRVYTRDGRVYTGTYQLANASVHVNTEYSSVKRSFDTMEVVLDELVKLIRDQQVDELVMGFPRNMDGTEGPRAQLYRDFARQLEGAAGLPVVLWDERRTTVDAHRILHESGKNGKKRKKTVDAVAAALILEGYLNFRRAGG